MKEFEARAEAQLTIIERICAINIKNRAEIAHLIANGVNSNRQILMICSSLNSWIAMNKIKGDVIIPSALVLQFIEAMH